MKNLSNTSCHWTDAQLISSLYDAGPEDGHLGQCAHCREQMAALQANRALLERAANDAEEVKFAFLAAQRRQIYARLAEPVRPWFVRRWASAATALLVLGGGLAVMEQYRHEQVVEAKISDVQLAQEMSRVSQDLEVRPIAPLQGLFEP